MTAPSGAWLLLDRVSRPPVALPVPRQACLGLTRAVLFSADGARSPAAGADGSMWRVVWEFAGGDASVAVCLAAWCFDGGASGKSLPRRVAESLVLGDDVHSGRAAGAGFVTEADWGTFVAATAGAPWAAATASPHGDSAARQAVGRDLLASISPDGTHPAWREGSPPTVEVAIEATVLRDAVRAVLSLDSCVDRFDVAVGEARLAAMRELAYGAGHEINNPLANIAARAQALLLEEADPERRRRLATIVDQSFRARDMIGGLMLFARPPKARPQRTDVGGLVRAVIEATQPLAASRSVRLDFSPSPATLDAWIDGTQIEEALRALLVNALEAVENGGRVAVAVEAAAGSAAAAAGDACAISIVDDGPGMDEETVKRAFDPFFSGREAGRGIGLGLSKAWRLVDINGGSVAILSRVGQGTRVTMTLPQPDQRPAVAAAR